MFIRHKNTYIIILYITLFFFISKLFFLYTNMTTSYPKIEKGYLDLSNYNFTNNLIPLNGEWEFYYKKFLTPSKKNQKIIPDGYIKLPSIWNSFIYKDKEIGAEGYGTYRAVIKVKNKNTSYALKVPDVSSSYRLYINGKLISENGHVGTSIKQEVPQWKPRTVVIFPTKDELELIVHVSNFHHIRGGMWESILLGSQENILKNREINLARSFFIFGILFLIGIHHFELFLLMKDNRKNLYLSLLSFSCAVREIFTREVAAHLIIQNISFSVNAKIEYLSCIFISVSIYILLNTLYSKEFSKKVLNIVLVIGGLYAIIILTTPLKIFSIFLNYYIIFALIIAIYSIYALIIALKNHRQEVKIVFMGIIILTLSSINDTLYINRYITSYFTAHMFPIAIVIFMLCQMHILTVNIVNAFNDAKNAVKMHTAFLQAQIAPHFLYNSLSTIIYLIDKSPKKAKELLLAFSDYLRGKFIFKAYDNNQLITLEKELDIIKAYITLQNARFEDNIDIIYNIDDACLQCNLPPLLLQPIAENSIKHADTSKKIIVEISAALDKQYLLLKVKDNGTGISRNQIYNILHSETGNKGVGLINTNQRLLMFYNQGLEIKSKLNHGTTVTIKIPRKEAEKSDENHTN